MLIRKATAEPNTSALERFMVFHREVLEKVETATDRPAVFLILTVETEKLPEEGKVMGEHRCLDKLCKQVSEQQLRIIESCFDN